MTQPVRDDIRWRCRWSVAKYASPERADPDEVMEGEGNLLTTAGASTLWTALTGGAGTAFNNANAVLGVGDSNAVEAVGQIDLQAAFNKQRKGMDASYPVVSGNQVTFRATFLGGDANFTWAEWGLFNAASGGTMLNRKVQPIGSKSSGAVWVFTITISLS